MTERKANSPALVRRPPRRKRMYAELNNGRDGEKKW
jgi:hypothetical protein